MPQPNLVPVSSSTSRSTQRSGMSGETSIVLSSPLMVTIIETSLSSLGTGRALRHPLAHQRHELRVRQRRRSPVAARIEGPQHQRIVVDVVYQIVERAMAVLLRILEIGAELRLRLALEDHGRLGGRHAPVRSAGREV